MKAIVNTGPGALEWLEWPDPACGSGQVRIRVRACGVCATDLEMIRGWERTGYPSIPGHEWSGVVDQVGEGADPQLLGRSCVAENVLADGGEVGFEHPGGYAAHLVTEAKNVHVLPDGFDAGAAALIEPLAVCVRALRRARCLAGPEGGRAEPPERCLVLGDGPIGLLAAMLLRRCGTAHTVLVGGRPARLELAREFGAAGTANYHDLHGELGEAQGRDWPMVVEASGSAGSLEAALLATRVGGRVLMVGDYGTSRAGFRWNRFIHGELELIGSNASAGAWPEAVRLAVDESLPLARLISARIPAAHFADAVHMAQTDRECVKVILDWTAA